MSDTTFRTKSEAPAAEVLPEGKETTVGPEVAPEVPYTDYEATHNHPYTADYFKLGETWDDPTGGFPKELGLIEAYLETKISSGEIANDTKTIAEYIKTMERTNNLTKEPRAVVRIPVIAAYVKFLMDKDNIKLNLARYGHH